MDRELARRSHAVFVRALEVEVTGRGDYVRQACAGDTILLQRVERLMAALDTSADFLETPALGSRQRPANVAVPGYRVVRPIGVGGMASVYEAIQENPERRVALKVMSRALAHTSAARRFRFETEVLARLQHPGIAQIFEAGTCGDGHGHPVPYFAMEFIEGARTITGYARDLPLHERLEMFAGVCDAVEHGHQLGVIHRDLKPGNILVDAAGRTKVIDFGVARSTDPEQGRITRRADVGQLIGTLNYMSPEQCKGAETVDIRSDVYSLGVVLYQLVAGRPPYELGAVSIPEAVRIITEGAPPKPSQFEPGARGDLDAIIGMAMDQESARRYGSAGALAADVRRFLHDQMIEARPPTMIRQARLFARRHRVLVGAGAVVLGAFVAAFVLVSVFAYRTALESKERLAAERRALTERDLARRMTYAASLGAALSSSMVQDVAQARVRLAMAPPELRNWEWALVSALVEPGETIIEAHQDMIYGFDLSRDGARLATGSMDGAIEVWDAATGASVTPLPGTPGSAVFGVSFSPDGRQLVSGSADGTVRVWDIGERREVRSFDWHKANVLSVSWGPEGLIASAADDGSAYLARGDTGEVVGNLHGPGARVHGVRYSADGELLVAWNHAGQVSLRSRDGAVVWTRPLGARVEAASLSADGSAVAAAGAGGLLRIWSVTGELLYDLSTSPSVSSIISVAFSGDGERLVTGQIDRTIVVWELGPARRRWKLLGHAEAVSGLAFSAAGDRVYSASRDRTLRIWDPASAQRLPAVMPMAGHTDEVLTAAYSPDGLLVASGGRDGTILLWDAEQARAVAQLGTGAGEGDADIFAVAFSPDGRTIASGDTGGLVRLWDARTGEGRAAFDTRGGLQWSVAYSPDGLSLACAGEDGVLRLLDGAATRIIRTFPGHDERIIRIAFSPDGKTLATASRDRTIRTWNVESGQRIRTLTGHTADVFDVVFDPRPAHAHRLYSGSRDQTIRAWDLRTGEGRVLDTKGHFVTSLSLSSDARRLAAGSWFGEVFLVDTDSFETMFSFRGQNAAARAVVFSPDGRALLCAGHDGIIRQFQSCEFADRARARARADGLRAEASGFVESLAGSHADPGPLAAAIESQTVRDELVPYVWMAYLKRTHPPPAAQAEVPDL